MKSTVTIFVMGIIDVLCIRLNLAKRRDTDAFNSVASIHAVKCIPPLLYYTHRTNFCSKANPIAPERYIFVERKTNEDVYF